MVLAHSRALKTCDSTIVVGADLREPDVILARARGLLDFAAPVAILLVAVLHFISDDDKPAAIISSLLDTVSVGSWLVISHVTGDFSRDAAARSAQEYKQVTPGATVRSRERILAFFDGLELAEPGLVRVPEWRPDGPVTPDIEKVWFLGAAGRKSLPNPPLGSR